MAHYRPRMRAVLTVPIYGTRAERLGMAESTETVQLVALPTRAELELNDHMHADGCTLTLDWHDAGVDPRLIDNATVVLSMGNANENQEFAPSSNVVFAGIVKEVETDRQADAAATVTLQCVDYTSLFLDAKPFGSLGIPAYSQTLKEAWVQVVSQTPGAGRLKNRIQFEGGMTGSERLGEAVSERFAKLAKVPTHPKTDAWAVWQQCVGMLGLVSYMRLDKCIVTTATNFYTEKDAPVLIWGRDLTKWNEHRVPQLRKPIMLTSFDPESGKTLEAFYPPQTKKEKKKKVPAHTVGDKAPAEIDDKEREVLQYPGVTNREKLQEVAKAVWELRSRQELEGHVNTSEMFVESEEGHNFPILTLKAGDSVRVMVDPEEQQLLASKGSDQEKVEHLVERGFDRDVAGLIVRGSKDIGRLESKYFLREGRIVLETTRDAGSFDVELSYVNRIQISGATAA